MKIQQIEFENFRNFKGYNKIVCSTDGKVTIIYGDNGDGKTTLHQLFQWVFYNHVHFNKTTSDKMYNLEYEHELEYNTSFSVTGTIDFEHNGECYSLRREWIYTKGLKDSKKIGEDVSLNKKNDDNDWKRLPNPEEIIETLLPPGLSEYFFFDGESMIADLKVKGKDSANKFRKALYSMFDLNVLENAVAHIGDTNLTTTALGMLYLSKGNDANNSNINILKTDIENIQEKIRVKTDELSSCKKQLDDTKKLVTDLSEKIGSTKSSQEYESQRKTQKELRESYLSHEKGLKTSFGEEVTNTYPLLLISKAISKAKSSIDNKKEKAETIPGLNKDIVEALTGRDTCICGRPLCQKEHDVISSYLKLFQPYSNRNSYLQFMWKASSLSDEFERDKLDSIISEILDWREKARKCDKRIIELDEEEKNSDKSIQKLIIDRSEAENDLDSLETKISSLDTEISKLNVLLRAKMKKFDEQTEMNAANEIINRKINIMKAVKEEFSKKLEAISVEYSNMLEVEIQKLLNTMLNSKRTVTVSPDFYIRVFDNYDDESKSEGQFAVVSFAYIGGILSLLKNQESLKQKEYPLVLDGPFSKLGEDHRKNVINTIPNYAPQIIIFSKDNLQNDFAEDKIGRVWTIKSNADKNVASVEEGFLW